MCRVCMEGLPFKTRQRYFLLLTIAFVIIAPLLVLYASGYRLSRNFELIKTGGIYVEVPISGASFYLNDELKGSGSLFQRNFFIQNLIPGTYTVRIDREGFQDWRKTFTILPTFIANGRALLLPLNSERVAVPRFIVGATATGTTQHLLINSEYQNAIPYFSNSKLNVSTFPLGATTTILYNNASTTVRDQGDIGLWQDKKGFLHAWWLGDEDRYPYFFCDINKCTRDILVVSGGGTIGHFDFLPDNNQFVIIEWPDGVFVTELDTRSPQNIQSLYPVPGATFRVINQDIFILDGGQLFRISL